MTEFLLETWAWIARIVKWLSVKLVAPLLALLVILGSVVLVSLGFKGLQIGGILGKLFGQKPFQKAVAISIPEGRVNSQGKPIPIGIPDSQGIVQVPVISVENPGLFSNPSTIEIVPPGEDKPIEVALPDGVKAKDIDSVFTIGAQIVAVTVKDGASVPVERIDDLIEKYDNI